MPLIGLIDPSYTESRKRYADPKRFRNPNWFGVDETVQKLLDGGVGYSAWTPEMAQVALDEQQNRDYISTTALLTKCPRSLVLERREPYIGSLDEMYASVRGTWVHAMLEGVARNPSVAEHRFFLTLDDTEVSCSPDLFTEHEMFDYKMTENPPTWSDPWPNHIQQLQYNRYIVNKAERWEYNGEPAVLDLDPHALDFKHLVVVYLGPKGPKPIEVRTAQPYVYGNGKTGSRKQPDIWSDDQVLEHLMPRLHALRCALDVYPDWPEGVETLWGGEEGWACPGKPWCTLPDCLAKRYPNGLVWDKP